MTKVEINLLVDDLKHVFDLVRLVDVSDMVQISFGPNGEIAECSSHCYASWNKKGRCENCISSKAFAKKSKLSKFEIVDDEIFHVISMYMEAEGTPYVLEMITKINDDTLFGAYGKSEFAQTIMNFNKKLYIDTLTQAYNRRYYEEQLIGLSIDAVAMVDIDDFKRVNDTFGHFAGDAVLKSVVEVLHAHIRDTDAVVRYGGDEFLLLFRRITKDAFFSRLKDIRQAVNEANYEACPGSSVSVSIGGYYCESKATGAIDGADKLLYLAKTVKNDVRLGACGE